MVGRSTQRNPLPSHPSPQRSHCRLTPPSRHLKRPPLRGALPLQLISARGEINSAPLAACWGATSAKGATRGQGSLALRSSLRSTSLPGLLHPVPPVRRRTAPPCAFSLPSLNFPPPLVLTPSALRPPPPTLPRIPPTHRESSRPPRRSGRSAPQLLGTVPRSLPPS